MPKKITAIVGTYRKGHIIDSAVTELLHAAQEQGAETNKIYLLDKNIEFCDNCRRCTQKIHSIRGVCVYDDDMSRILDEIDKSDCIILASPINCFTITAIMKRFVERMMPYGYWPWGMLIPRFRVKLKTKKAVLITSSGCPEFLGRILFSSSFKILKAAASSVGAKVIKKIYIGSIAISPDQTLPDKYRKRAYTAGRALLN